MGVKNVKVACVTDNGNTRVGDCWNDIGVPRAVIFVPKNKTYTTVSIAAFLAAFLPDLLNDHPSGRAYPVQNIVEVTDSTTAPNVQTFPGDGSQIISGENAYTMKYRWIDGGFCLQHSLRQSKGQTKAFFIVDSFGQLIGTDGGVDLIKGIVGYNYTEPFKFATTNAAVADYNTMLSFRPEQVNENIAILDFANDGGLAYLSSLEGLFNVDISQAAAPTSTHVKVKAVVSGCGSTDLYDLYADALAVPGAWAVTRVDTGGTIAVSAVAKSAVFNGWDLTLTAATGLTVNVALVGPTELDALDVSGYASNKLVQIIP
jgi:hypothetical protein